MKFYDRENEISVLRALDDNSFDVAQFTVIVGRRRTGKTTLVQHALGERGMIYLFVGKKSEQFQCIQFQKEVETVLGIHIHGQITRFSDLLKEIMIYSRHTKVTVMIDEFQRLAELDPGIVSEIQDVWDTYHAESHIHLIACGSIYSMMHRIFEDSHEPLFGRKTAKMEIKPFSIAVLKGILRDHNPAYTAEDLLMLYSITGGVAKYVAQLMDDGCRNSEDMLNAVCKGTSIFLEEGSELLVGEFGRQYQIYYSILQLIASGVTSQSQIDSIIGKNTGRYLDTLENEYSLIRKQRPMWAKPASKGVKYYINDCFLMFWFRFIEGNRSMVELGKYGLLIEAIKRDYSLFSGIMLEKYFRQKYAEMDSVTEVSNWWDSNSENEIDLIAIEKLNRKATIAEVKRNARKYNPELLKRKYEFIKKNLSGYDVTLSGLSMDDM